MHVCGKSRSNEHGQGSEPQGGGIASQPAMGSTLFLECKDAVGKLQVLERAKVPGKFINLGNKKNDYNEFCRMVGR